MTRLIVAALLVLTPPGAAQDLLPDQTLEIELRTSDSALEGHGPSRRLQYGVTFDGTLYIWAASLDFDPVLRVSAPEGELLADDDDSGGGTTACVVLEVSRDELPTITVAAAVPDSAGKFLLHVSEAPETESTRAAAAWALEELAEVRRLRVSRSLDEARERLAAALDELLRVEAWQGSALVAEACWRFGPEAEALAALQPARAACTVCRDHRERTLPDEHPDLQRARNKLAKTTYLLGDLAGARVLFEKLLEICSRTLPDDHPNLQAARTNVAATLVSLGDPAGGRVLFEKVLEVKSRTLPDDHPDLQDLRENLALAIRALGDLHGAKALQEKAFEVLSRTLPDEHPRLQDTRLNLAATLYELDEFAGARALVEKVLDVFLRTLPDDHPDLQAARAGLASTINVLGDVAGARALREKVLEVRSRTLPDDHPDLQSARKDLASTIRELGDLEGARALEEKVLEVRSRTLPDDHPDLQSTRSDLAKTLFLLGDLAGARALLEEVFEVRSRTLPDDHLMLQALRCSLPVTIVCQLARAERSLGAEGDRTSENQGRERCVELIGAMCRAQVRAARAAILESPGREAEERCASLAKLLDWPLSFAQGFGVFDALPELEAPSFELSETTRVATITSAELARKAAKAPEYEDLREELRKASDALVGLAQKGTTSEEFDRARTRREAAERKLVALANELSGGKQPGLQLDVESLAAALDADEAAVGLRRFKRLRIGVVETLDSTGQPAVRDNSVNGICAFVVRSSKEGARRSSSPPSALTLVDLGPIATIEEAVHAWRDGLGVGNGSRGVAAATPERSARDVDAQGASLREKIFDPLLPALAGARHIVVALDDVLHLVPLDALPSGDGSLVGDRWQIETRTTLTELLRSTEPLEDAGLLVALGDIEYRAEELPEEGGEAIQLAEPAVAPRAAEDAGILRGSAWSGGFSPLPGTGVEVRGIERCFREQFGASAAAELYEQAGATRERLLEVAPKARWLHIATHGWFAPESIRSWSDPEPLDKRSDLGVRLGGEQQVRGMSPMLLCGLALAGANLPEDAVGRVPGLVTADELSTLDLWSCELVVLSACDTNVGERRAGQGVASLQKALQMAGARSVITSLWKVPDEATKELMLDFYRRLWVEKKPKWEALACGARSGRGCEGGGP